MKEAIKYQLHELEKMVTSSENLELQKKVSEFVVDSISKMKELNINPIYSTKLLGILVSGYPVIPLTEENAKWKKLDNGDEVHFLCENVIKRNGHVYNKFGYIYFEPDSDRGITDDKYSLRPLELPCQPDMLEPLYLRLDYKLSEKSLADQIKEHTNA